MQKKKIGKSKKRVSALLAVTMAGSLLYLTPVSAGDTWPFQGDSSHGVNQPSVHGYTSNHILDWSPERDPHAEMLRSRVPLQERIAPLAATQANPLLASNVKMMNVSGDYGNAFIENAPYTNKFGQYHFGFWQYVDYWSPWHGTASAYTPPEYYDELGQSDWQQKWFEFGILNIPNPTYTDAAHKNGVLSLAGVFFSNNDRGQQTYKQMIVKDAEGNYPVAEKMIEMAEYFGYDGYFINQEEVGPNVVVADIPDYIGFMKTLQEGGLYVQWYDSLNTATGANTFQRTFTDNNIKMLFDRQTKETVSQSFFFDYGVGNTQINSANTYLNNLNQSDGTNYNIFDIGFAGLEAGRDRFKSVQGTALNNKLSSGLPRLSIATLGADFVHAGLDEDIPGQTAYPNNKRADNDYQWMTKLREQLWWSGPNVNPKNTAVSATNTVADVYADNRYWPGMASVIAERSVIGDSNFYTNFNTGHGLSYYKEGLVSNPEEWSNISLQDVPVSWQWWQDTTGSSLNVDFDYGPEYNYGPAAGSQAAARFDYEQIGAYDGGSSLAVNGTLDADNFLRLYKTDLAVSAGSKASIAYNKPSASDGSSMSVGLVFADNTNEVVRVAIPGTGAQSNGWVKQELDLGAYAGKKIAAFGLVFAPGGESVAEYQMNVGSIRISDGTAVKPAAPTGLSIDQAFTDEKELYVSWNLDGNYDSVKQYNVYVNDVFVGGKYDDIFYVKHLPANSGSIRVAAVGADGVEGEAAVLPFDLTKAVSNIELDAEADGTLTVSWDNPVNASGRITVGVESRNWITTAVPVTRKVVLPAGSTSVVFDGMPVNGDDIIVTIKSGTSQAVAQSGNFIDKQSEPYAEAWSWNGNTLSLPMPNARDWRYMYFYQGNTAEDATLRSFTTTYSQGNKDRIIRGRSTKASLSFSVTASTAYVVMEDYAGNRSQPVFLRNIPAEAAFAATGTGVVAPGGEATFQFGLKNSQEVLAQDITFQYDAGQLEYIDAESLDENKLQIVATDEETVGEARMLAVHLGAAQSDPNGDLLTVKFRAKANATASVSQIAVNVITANGTGVESTLATRTAQLQIQGAATVDKTVLEDLIAEAWQTHNSAVEGTRVGQFPSGSKALLENAIRSAEAVANNNDATATEIAQAEYALSSALQSFQASVITNVGGDHTGDNQLTVGDLAVMAKAYGKTSTDTDWADVRKSDLNGDGKIDIEDLVILAKLILKW